MYSLLGLLIYLIVNYMYVNINGSRKYSVVSSPRLVVRDPPYMTSLGNGQEEDFFPYAQCFRVNAACTAASPANNYT